MRWSKTFIPTLKENPKEASTPSHVLMLKSGLIRPLASGIYSYLPLGWRVLKNITSIIREEMDRIGGQEFFLPMLSSKEIWEETRRWQDFGDELFRLKDRKQRELCLAPTHEEIITHIARSEIRSYRDLPQIWYQIQTKFRDEPRPRSAVLRARQFIMKDSYSLDADEEGLNASYEAHREAYERILQRCGLKYFCVEASSGVMGGGKSEEFMVPCEYGEDRMVRCTNCGYKANLEIARSTAAEYDFEDTRVKEIHTPAVRTVEEVSEFLQVPKARLMKSLLYMNERGPAFVLIRGDHEASEAKVQSVLGCEARSASAEEVLELLNANIGFIGPYKVERVPVYADLALRGKKGFVTGANRDDYHVIGLNPERDLRVTQWTDLRRVDGGDTCVNCGAALELFSAIEVGHIFQLGTKYSRSMRATYLDKEGKEQAIVMGSYGIGLERIMGACIELYHDSDGMSWPIAIAPFKVVVVPLNMSDKKSRELGERIYVEFDARGMDVLLDDRDGSPGFKFKDADLIGIPFRITIGEKSLKEDKVEIYERRTREVTKVSPKDVVESVEKLVCTRG
ncbi:hypothetical protein AMJ40_00505 [candidate division TA06 bacterium DG_26]|uniref:Proline--tRNA ligase n=1 Tax=candidate division TA06 bacterium DG_26 TaxID=1703771 RepID=A0A0S7WM25_UNCT6|nr:MAG: hypothetical protein AMJ40_00505 [candidate division TA06 bacterium DG_26]